jgi:hypothetical protein
VVNRKHYSIYMAYPFLGKPLVGSDRSRKDLRQVSSLVNWSNVCQVWSIGRMFMVDLS